MDVRKRGLGRGLGALIPGAAQGPAAVAVESAATATVESITANPFQPRETFDEAAIAELTESIRSKGLLQPLLVRRVDSGYQLIAGERRFRAAQRAGLARVPITVREADDREALELALIENLQRENLNPIEEARAFKRLADEFSLTQEDIAQQVNKSRSAVTNSLRLLQLPREVIKQLESGELSAGHARSLLALDATQQVAVGREVAAKRLSVRDAEQLVRERSRAATEDLEQRALEAELARALGTKVHLRHNKSGSGHIVIDYFSLDGLDGLLARLGVRR
ncbi:MAG: ParB/RepB/Spo0J family partition protein [Proteobacteria bacterium]|nr:ParB/RepB/Spo0J family partition protein [Pseudomonadota bacterium]